MAKVLLEERDLSLRTVKLLNSLPEDEKTVAIAVFKSNLGIKRNDIERETGINKRFVTRYLNKLIEKKIVKKLRNITYGIKLLNP